MASEILPEIEFKDIPNWPGYQVSKCGVVRSCRTRGYGKELSPKWHNLKPQHGPRGYLMVGLKVEGKRRSCGAIHVLVLKAWRGPRPKGMVARHLNDIKHDNRLDNLEWGTCQENTHDAFRNGRRRAPKPNPRLGTDNHAAKLDEGKVAAILRRHREGAAIKPMAREYGVSQKAMQNVVRRMTWKHVTIDDATRGALIQELSQ